MNFQELGLTLQQEREAKGLTIEAVMEATKISRINLVALENGDRSSLPHPVYTKGFVKSYARLLGLDSDEFIMVVDREYQSEEPEVEDVAYDVSPAAEKAFQEADAPATKKRSVWPSILLVVGLGCAILLVVLALNKDDNGTESVQPEQAQVSEQAETPEPEPVATEEAQPEAAPVEEEAQPEQATEEEAAAPETPAAVPEAAESVEPVEPAPEAATAQPAPEPAPVVSETTDAAQADEQEQPQYAHVLIIRATTDKGCWIGVWRGEEANMARDFVLKKGEPLRLMFNNPRRIRIGNVAGVEVLYNGKPYPLADNKSNIQTLFFGMNNN